MQCVYLLHKFNSLSFCCTVIVTHWTSAACISECEILILYCLLVSVRTANDGDANVVFRAAAGDSIVYYEPVE